MIKSKRLLIAAIVTLLFAVPALASGSAGGEGAEIAITFLWLAIIIVAAKIGSIVERFGQPAVLGELVFGIVLGNLTLLGLHWFDPIGANDYIKFVAELGVVILLFKVGLESNLTKMKKVGLPALLVATIGVVTPFVLGTWVVGPWLFSEMSFNTHLFLGATLTATSVGITARVFADLKKLQMPEAQVVLGAAVLDDVMGLIILAVVSAIVTTGGVTLGGVAWITGKAAMFLVGAIVLGGFIAPYLGRLFAKIHTGMGMKMVFSLAFMLIGAYLASVVGLAPIVGAFAAGLVMDPVHFTAFRKPKLVEDIHNISSKLPAEYQPDINQVLDHHSEKHVEDYIDDIGHFFIPVFFIMTGFNVKLEALFNLPALALALAITGIAIVGKLVAGLGAARGMNRWVIGVGMIPRGEVGLIFAAIGQGIGVLNDELFSVIVIMVILTTLIPPPVLAWLLRKNDNRIQTQVSI